MFSDYEIYRLKLDVHLPRNSSIPLPGLYPRAVVLKLFGFRTLLSS